MKKKLAISLIISILVGLAIPLIGCGSGTEEAELSETSVVTVQRGNLTIDITASGNLALSYTAEPAFEIAGYVEEVLVEEGDTVEEGQILASLDNTSLERTVKQAEQSVKTAEIDLEKVTSSYRRITYPYTYSTFAFDVPAAVVAIHDAELELGEIEDLLDMGLSPEQYAEVSWQLHRAQDNLEQAGALLRRGVGVEQFIGEDYSGETSPLAVADFWTLRAAQLDMDKAQVSLDNAIDNFDIAKEDMEKAVVVAPFAGFITNVGVEGGDEVFKGTVVAQVADPTKFEADILVSEMDIFQVKLGGEAWVEVDAMQGMTLPAEVTHISPTAIIQSGVVNYGVKVEVQSLETVMQERQETRQEAIEKTQMAIPEGFQLREGLTVTVSIIVEEATNVLLVPNSAISTQGKQTYVQIVLPDGTTEERAITTGISDWQYTEVTGGLSEGEQLIVPQGTATTTTTPQQRPSGGMMIPRVMGK